MVAGLIDNVAETDEIAYDIHKACIQMISSNSWNRKMKGLKLIKGVL